MSAEMSEVSLCVCKGASKQHVAATFYPKEKKKHVDFYV